MTAQTPLCSCGAPAELGAFLCNHCSGRLRQELRRLAPSHLVGDDSPWAGLGADLAAQLARQARIGDSDTRGGDKPVPFHEKASDVRSLLTAALRPWALWIAGQLPATPATLPLPELLQLRSKFLTAAERDGVDLDTAAVNLAAAVAGAELRMTAKRAAQRIDRLWHAEPDDLAAFLLEHVERIRVTDGSAELAFAVHDAVKQADRVIDGPPPQWYAGPCGAPLPEGPCQVPLMGRTVRIIDDPRDPEAVIAVPDPDEVLVCRDRGGMTGCGSTHMVGNRRQQLLSAAADVVGDTRMVTQAVTGLHRKLDPSRLRGWKHRGRLIDRGTPCPLHGALVWAQPVRDRACQACTAAGPSMWRVGDVMALLETTERAAA